MEATPAQAPGAPPPRAQASDTDEGGAPLLGLAAVAVAVAVAVINQRMDPEWGTGVFFVLNAIAAAGLLGVGISALTAGERPTGNTTAVLVSGYFVLALAIGNFADILGAEGGSGSIMWTTLLFAAIVAYPGWMLGSPISVLFSDLALGISFLAFIDWVFDYESFDTLRWLLLILVGAYAATAVVAAGVSERHGVQLVNAAGLTTIALALTVFVGAILGQFASLFEVFGAESDSGGQVGWEIVTLIAAVGLVGYAAIRREPGPGYLGGIALFLFVSSAAIPGDDGASLVGWPIVLVLLAGAAVAAAAVMREA